uniref:Ladinin-1 isoform X1 n=1 Tax=Pogona vitticeps TaxID=103695 RepID=A0A6J0SPC9_9SAUR
MSFSRKNWSALSSLARQWSAEDEEEQERERRRRHRQQSSISEANEETSSTEKQDVIHQAPNRFCSSSEAKPPKLRSSKQESERTLIDTINEEENRSVRRRIEIFNHMKQDKKEAVGTRKLEKGAAVEKARPLSQPTQKQKIAVVEKCEGLTQKGPSRVKQENLVQEQEEATLEKQKSLDQEEKERILTNHENLDQEVKEPQTAKDEVFSDEEKAPNTCESPKLVAVQNEVATQQPQRASWERRSISRLEVKIQPRVRNFTETVSATSSSRPQVTERSIPKSTDETVNSPSNKDGSEASLIISRPLITYSSSFKRVTPRTISFRVVSKKDKEDDTVLSRSASMRLPANTGRLEEKLEKYTSAVQRAGSIKLAPSARRNFQSPLEGVASKRSIFETTVPSRVEPATLIRKESLKIPGGVSSRINLWISRTQEPSKDEGIKDIRRSENDPQQNQWGKHSDDS